MKLLLSPYKLNSDLLCIESLHITKDNKGVTISNVEPDLSELRKHFSEFPKAGRDALAFFTKKELLETRQAISKVNTDPNILRNALLRKVHEKFLQLKPFARLVKWHHKVKQENNNFKNSPCIFSSFRPVLTFHVRKKLNTLDIECSIEVGSGTFPILDFTRSQFLLESRGEYFLLTWKDYQTLEWLTTFTFPMDPSAFRTTILARLQDDYKVNGHEALDVKEIEVIPEPRVMLSEISNAFLVLTPQWSYDGFVQDGPWKELAEINTKGELYSLRRNKVAEDKLREQLESLHPNFPRQLNGYYYLPFADAQKKQWFAKAYHKLLDSGIELTGMDMLKHFRYSPEKIASELKVIEQSNQYIQVSLRVSFGKEEIPLLDLQKMLWAGQKAVVLKDSSLGLINDEWMQQYSTLVKHGRIENKYIFIGHWYAFEGQLDADHRVLKKDWWDKWNRWAQPSNEQIYLLPSAVQVEALRGYQHKGYEWLRLLGEAGAGGCLADDMGLGKTLQAICFLAHRLEHNPVARALVVCPSSLLYNWQQELRRFAPSLPVTIHHGPARDPASLSKLTGHIFLTSYGTLRSDLEQFTSIFFDSIIADESHTIKNPSSLTSRAITELKAHTRIALSGTPVMNNTFDLYGQFAFILPGMLGTREFFKKEYSNPVDIDGDPEKIKALQKLTAPFLLRRTKQQVAPELPEKMESILWCEMDSDQRMAYESIRENIKANLFLEIKDKGLGAGKLSVLHGIMKLRQICNSGELVKDEDIFTYESVKTKVLLEELKNITITGKALVFSQFTSMLTLLERDLSASNLPFLRLDGSTPPIDRQRLVNSFNNDDSVERIFLLSLKAGNAGLNLTAADYVFLFDPWWNKAVEQQAIDRTHRIGQTKNIFAYRMLCRNSIEEKILRLQERKAKVSEELVGGDDSSFIHHLTEADIAFLFS